MRAHRFTLVAAAMLRVGVLPFGPSHGASMTVPVGGSIQAAVDAASPGDTIYIGPGEYFEKVRIVKDHITMLGAGADLTIIRALSWGDGSGAVVLGGPNTRLYGLTIADGDPGVWSSYDGDYLISDCRFIGNRQAVVFSSHTGGRLERCVFWGNGTALFVDLTECQLRDCEFYGNGVGIHLCEGSALLTGSRLSCNEVGVKSLYSSSPVLTNCVLRANGHAVLSGDGSNARLVNCTLWGNICGLRTIEGAGTWGPPAISAVNSIIWRHVGWAVRVDWGSVAISHSDVQGGWPGERNTDADPRFADPLTLNYRLQRGSPCVDAGDNDASGLPDTDIAGMDRIMFGGRSFTVDMGAYEYYINRVEPVPGTDELIYTWSSLANKAYSIFYSSDLFNWHTAIDNFPSLGNQTTSWTDDGSLTGVPPLLAPRRFYRILENP